MNKKIIISESEKEHIKKIQNLNEQDWVSLLLNKFGKDAPSSDNKTETDDVKSDDEKKTDTDSFKSDDVKSADSYMDEKSTGSVDSKWMKITKKVIDKFEGGYWNPECGHPTGGMGKSTETMFGLDRKNGGWDSKPCGQKFFGIIDNEKKKLGKSEFCKTWKHGYRGGSLENKLKELAATCMKESYDRNAGRFFNSELKKRVESNNRLLMHFSYACWNGSGFFQKFANSLKKGVSDGLSDKELVNLAIKDRKSTRLYHQDKVAAVITDKNLNSDLA